MKAQYLLETMKNCSKCSISGRVFSNKKSDEATCHGIDVGHL